MAVDTPYLYWLKDFKLGSKSPMSREGFVELAVLDAMTLESLIG